MPQEEKPFPPSKKKIQKEKKKGNVPFSLEFTHSLFLLFALALFLFLFRWKIFKGIFISLFLNINHLTINQAFALVFRPLVLPTLLFFLFMWVGILLLYGLQKGWIWTWQPRLSFGGKKKKTPLFVSIAKVFLLSLILFLVIKKVPPILDMKILLQREILLCFLLLLGFFLIGWLDLFYQRYRFLKEMKMSKQEVDEEKRETQTHASLQNRQKEKK